jgi:2',3'-cyclic-nucleotide 2'-phosphodiesterase/3'-nucleotidase
VPFHRQRKYGIATVDNLIAKLRILATTDLHMMLVAHDYASDTPSNGPSLAGISTLITKARADSQVEGRATVLFDNGDFLQGTPLADWQSTQPVNDTHPIARVFNDLGYDAIGLGNHDLDYGATYLDQVVNLIDAPTVSTNLRADIVSGIQRHAMLSRTFATPQGPATIRLGVVSALPLETAIWNKSELPNGTSIEDPFASLTDAARLLRKQGADLIIALVHMGMDQNGAAELSGSNGAWALGQMPEIDVVIAGHTHQRFPLEPILGDHPASDRPTVMPGNAASDLGVIDLDVVQARDGRWQIRHHSSELWPNTTAILPDPAIIRINAASHQATRAYLAQKVGDTPYDMHSYFALVYPGKTLALAARAKAIAVSKALAQSDFGHLPVLATATTRAVGGARGPSNYIHIAKGPVLRRHLSNFTPATNRICAVPVNGADLRNWLEHSSRVYNQLLPDTPEQPLLDHNNPSFIFDTIYGLDYEIDPSRPIGQRIKDLRIKDTPITPDQRFIIATNQFRAAGGGGYGDLNLAEPVFQFDLTPAQSIAQALQNDGFAEWMDWAPWRLTCDCMRKGVFECSPKAAHYFSEIKGLAPEILGRTETGFDRIQVTL